MNINKPLFPYIVLSIILSLCSGLAEIKYNNFFIPFLLIFVSAVVLGLFRPKYFIIWSIIPGAGIFITHLIANIVGFQIPGRQSLNILFTLFAFIPSIAGAYLGVVLSKNKIKIRQ